MCGRPYTLAGGQQWHVWFDRPSLGLDGEEHQESVDAMATQLGHLIDAEVRAGVPLHRIVLGMYLSSLKSCGRLNQMCCTELSWVCTCPSHSCPADLKSDVLHRIVLGTYMSFSLVTCRL